jgi:UDP-glucose 4-epimerase
MNWLITGGCGFIGTALIRKLLEEDGHNIRILDNLSVGTEKDLASVCTYTIPNPGSLSFSHDSSQVQLVVGDIKDPDICIRCSEDADVIVHLAANTGVGPSVEDPRADMEANVVGIFNVLEAARLNKVRRFIFASSGAPVGECTPPIHEELAPHPVSPYGASKLAGEGYCSAYYRSFGVETVCLRFGNVYGPGSGHKNSVVAKFIRKALSGETLEIYGDGKQTRDFIYIDDLTLAIRLAARVPGIGGETFQIATNAETTVGELVEKLIPAMKKAGISVPEVVNGPPRLGDVMRNYSDTSKAKRLLNWECLYDLDRGLFETIAYFTVQRNKS